MFSFSVNSLHDLPEAAKALLAAFPDDRVFAFHGSMGAGKTTFIKTICEELGVGDHTSSPTFALVNEYATHNNEPVYHFDFYRIRSEQEAADMGFEEYAYSGDYCFIEWPEKISSLLPAETIHLNIEVTGNNSRRFFVSEHYPT